MQDPLPKFERPPVKETVIGLQFSPLEEFSTAHVGLFWAELTKEWSRAEDAARLPDQFERFGDDRSWATPGLQIVQGNEGNRILIIRNDDERLIQIQNTRFVYNWRQRQVGYPTYGILSPEFRGQFESFRAFTKRKGLHGLVLNQWEITYVNQLSRGDMWNTLDDWKNIVPGFFVPGSGVDNLSFDGFGGHWQLVIADGRGRLHVSLQRAKIMQPVEGPEIMALQLTARGPVDETQGMDPWSGLDLGHEAIVRCFTAMTSPTAHERWGRQR